MSDGFFMTRLSVEFVENGDDSNLGNLNFIAEPNHHDNS